MFIAGFGRGAVFPRGLAAGRVSRPFAAASHSRGLVRASRSRFASAVPRHAGGDARRVEANRCYAENYCKGCCKCKGKFLTPLASSIMPETWPAASRVKSSRPSEMRNASGPTGTSGTSGIGPDFGRFRTSLRSSTTILQSGSIFAHETTMRLGCKPGKRGSSDAYDLLRSANADEH